MHQQLTLPLDATLIASAAEKMIEEYGEKALTKADYWVKNLQAEDFGSFAQTWETIREAIKGVPKPDDRIRR